MSLATRCTSCGTVFRVVQDQLKVSEGWVRCGRCSEVFNALEGLLDLERDMPPRDSDSTRIAAAPGTSDIVIDSLVPTAAPTTQTASLVDKIDAQLLGSREGEHGAAPAINPRDRLDFPDAQFDTDMGEEDAPTPPAGATTPSAGEGIDGEPDAPVAAPEFLQRAQRHARWQTPRMRALQAASVAVLFVALALQVVHHDRDIIAARWNATDPLLTAWCAAMSCTIEAPRRIDDVAVESTALTRTSYGPDAFRLSVALRNRGATTVAQPAVDLTLTDANGQVIARRVLAARDFGIAATAIKAGGEATLQLVLSAGVARVSGYTVEIFYP